MDLVFKERFEDIFSPQNIKIYLKADIEVNVEKLSDELLRGKYIPSPLQSFELKKSNNKTREIKIATDKDKLVQKVLYEAINKFFDKQFSNRSYGYRIGKSTIKAIKRCKDFINRKYFYVFKSDIKDFFENVNHDKLINLLDRQIEDKRIIRLIVQFIKSGILKKEYFSHEIGVHQGDILSPLLSNIYLNEFDKFLESKNIEFVRYADDFVIFMQKNNKNIPEILNTFLKNIDLEISKEKSYFSDIYKGFSFLGCFFRNNNVYIDKEKLYSHIESVKELQNKELSSFLKKIENKIDGLTRYYEKVITSNQDTEYLKGVIKEIIIDRLSIELKDKSKKELKEKIKTLNLKIYDYDKLIDIAYEKNRNEIIPKEKIEKQQKTVLKNKIKSSVIVIEEFGTSLGVSKNTLVIKKRGKIAKKLPLSHIEKIIIQAKGVSISSNLIYVLQKRNISVEFIDYRYNPYAMIYGVELSYPKLSLKQFEIINSEKRIEFAREFVKAKIVNQRNYLKIMSKYHKNLKENVIKIDKIKSKIKNAKKIDELMGYEGSIANIYWNGIAKILNEKDFKRITKGATDTINSALNYGYAILYNKVQKALIKAGLGINISFLHSFEKKPVLVFDFIEQFRCVAVDKAICFSIKKSDDISVNKGMLTKEAKRRIVEEVNERLSAFYKFNGKKYSLNSIIEFQAFKLRDAILNNTKYKSFIARY